LKLDARLMEGWENFPIFGVKEAIFVDTYIRLRRVVTPCLVLWGEEDQLNSARTARRMYNTLRCHKTLKVLKDTGHYAHLDSTRKVMCKAIYHWIKHIIDPAKHQYDDDGNPHTPGDDQIPE
jgi:pimeloyl-ACP methyl ester carboxylesterase